MKFITPIAMQLTWWFKVITRDIAPSKRDFAGSFSGLRMVKARIRLKRFSNV